MPYPFGQHLTECIIIIHKNDYFTVSRVHQESAKIEKCNSFVYHDLHKIKIESKNCYDREAHNKV